MGRKDSLSASKSAATNNIPAPNSTVATLVTSFQNVGLSLDDMVALSGILISNILHFTSLMPSTKNKKNKKPAWL